VKVACAGDPKGIVSGTTKITKDPVGLTIAAMAAKVIEATSLLKDGFSFQTGAGGVSLAVAHFVRQRMEEDHIVGSFALGGITGYMVDMLEKGFFQKLIDVQGFDLKPFAPSKEILTTWKWVPAFTPILLRQGALSTSWMWWCWGLRRST
jgi:citrate lyase subunit alpha/citrate CoA-transferase